jgi:hypothetical protein
MTIENALDPPPARRPPGKAPHRRIAAAVAGVVVAMAVIAVILVFTLGHSNPQSRATPARAERGASAQQQVQPPPAVTAQTAAQTRANLAAAQRAANSPKLAATHVQVAAVSPPGGAAPRGAGVSRSSTSVGPSDG